ncbi:hypothetical protein [Rhodothermus marinus]|uniref:hypothetical protein n=1 Tax=Rhodothermus marinus TaxID=29549 RepID=UPI000AD936B4|nr:hypothetical protein [Rhodothermus marinus]
MADAVIPTYLVERFGPIVRGLITIGLLAAGYSTLEGLLVAVAAIVGNDLYRSWALRRGCARSGRTAGAPTGQTHAGGAGARTFRARLRSAHAGAFGCDPGAERVYGLFAATFAPVLMGVLGVSLRPRVVVAAALTALLVHFGIYYGQIGPYWNNPAVPATWAVLLSTMVALLGRWMPQRTGQPA